MLLDDGSDPTTVCCPKLDNFSANVLPVKPVASSCKETREKQYTWLWNCGVQHEKPEQDGHESSMVQLTHNDQVLRKGSKLTGLE